jgi:hypothetical protein
MGFGIGLNLACTPVWVSYSGTYSGFFLHGRGSHMLISLLLRMVSLVENMLEM